jgi:AcrR family transcriptional regulator
MPERAGQGAPSKRGRVGSEAKPTPPSRTNAEWSAATIHGLIRLARRAFAQRGYAATSLEQIAAEAGLTKGAVYYHFRSKQGLFEVVLRDVQRDLVARIEARAEQYGDPLAGLQAGCEVFLELATDDDVRQIVLVDGPAVLGWAQWRAIDAEFGLGSLKQGLAACRDVGVFRSDDVELSVLAHCLSGAMNEAVFLIAESSDRARAFAEAKRVIAVLLTGLAGGRRGVGSDTTSTGGG